MSAQGKAEGRHSHPHGGPDDGGFDWFKVLDIAVWTAVFIIAVLGFEWLVGKVIRERIAAGAAKHLASQQAGTE